MYFLVVRQKFTANVVVGLFGNESPDSNRFTLVTPKPENGVRLQATLVWRNGFTHFYVHSLDSAL